MNKFTKQLYGLVGEKEGVSAEEVEKEIKLAIFEAQKSTDPKVLAKQAKIPKINGEITPEALMVYIIEELKKENLI